MYTTLALTIALLAGSSRALLLWRYTVKVELVNVAVVTAFGENRDHQIPALLEGIGSAPYLELACVLGKAAARLVAVEGAEGASARELREQLGRESGRALVAASGRLRKSAWLDAVTVMANAWVGIGAVAGDAPSGRTVLALVAATLLWVANVYTARSLATRMYAGATALVDSFVEILLELNR